MTTVHSPTAYAFSLFDRCVCWGGSQVHGSGFRAERTCICPVGSPFKDLAGVQVSDLQGKAQRASTQTSSHAHAAPPAHNTPPTPTSLLMLVKGRVVYFGPGGEAAFDYVRELPVATATSPYQSWLNEVVSGTARRGWA